LKILFQYFILKGKKEDRAG